MKKIEPVVSYSGEGGYPSLPDRVLSRRGFLTAASAGAAALGGALLGGEAAAGKRRAPKKVIIDVYHRLAACKYRVEKLITQTYDRRLAAFLKNKAERAKLTAAFVKVLKRHKCADLHDRKRLAKMEAQLERALAAHYRRRTRRKTARPIVNVMAGKGHRSRTFGWAGPPSAPIIP